MSYTTNQQLADKAHKLGLPLIGVFSKDELPEIPKPGYYIVNLENETNAAGVFNGGSHWVGIGIENNKAVYWDSYGVAPPVEVQRFLKQFIPYQYSTKMIQSPKSGWCGMYQMYFIWFMTTHRQKMPDYYRRFIYFLRLWSPEYSKNLELLRRYMRTLK
jgi:hypothetical protein